MQSTNSKCAELSGKFADAKQQVKQATANSTRKLAPFFRPVLKTLKPVEINSSYELGYN